MLGKGLGLTEGGRRVRGSWGGLGGGSKGVSPILNKRLVSFRCFFCCVTLYGSPGGDNKKEGGRGELKCV